MERIDQPGISAWRGSSPYDSRKDTLWKIQEDFVNLTPDSLYRNILIARKLQTLANYNYRLAGKKPEFKPIISCQIGFGHAKSLEHILIAGPETTLKMLDLISTETLKKIVDANGGVDALCRTVVIPTDKVIIDKEEAKYFLTDNYLKQYLLSRLDLQSLV